MSREVTPLYLCFKIVMLFAMLKIDTGRAGMESRSPVGKLLPQLDIGRWTVTTIEVVRSHKI